MMGIPLDQSNTCSGGYHVSCVQYNLTRVNLEERSPTALCISLCTQEHCCERNTDLSRMLIAKENVSDMLLTKSANWARKEEAGTDDTTH